MACPEIVHLFDAMRMDARGRLTSFERTLHSRFGDPRVYETKQVEQVRAESKTQSHTQSPETSQLLKDAYLAQAKRNREKHTERMTKFRSYPSTSSHLVSRAKQAPRTLQPPSQQTAAQPESDSSPP